MELLTYLCKSAAILAMFYAVYIAILRKDTFFNANRHYLMSGIAAAIILPLIQFTKRVYIEIPASSSFNFPETISTGPITAYEEAMSINWLQIALLIYGIGAVVMLFQFLRQLYVLFRLLTKYPNEKRDGYTYIQNPQDCAPFSFFKYIVYNPALHSREELLMILKHEEVHGSQWHSIDILTANLMLIFQWINPLAWFYKKSIQENLEFIADNETVQQVKSVKQYQLALVKASSTIPIPALTTNFYQSFIKKRILMLNKSTSNKINAWKLSIILPLLAVFLWSFNVNEVIEYSEATNTAVSDFSSSFSASEANKDTQAKGSNANALETPSEKSSNANLPDGKEDKITLPIAVATGYSAEDTNSFKNTKITVQDVLLTITKNTTKQELEVMKTDLKSKGFSFDYSNLQYNDSQEIIGISITYKDKNGNSGNYSVSSDSPINNIIIKASGKRISMRSAGNGDYSHSSDEDEEIFRARDLERQQRMKERQMEMEERRQEMEERREKMHEEMEEMREEMMERQVRMRSENDSTLFRNRGTRDSSGLLERRRMHHDSSRASVLNSHSERKDRMRARNYGSIPMENLKRITKDASENELDRLKSQFKSEGVSFSYSSLKRNELGEIIKIKVKLDNNNGSISSSSYDNNGKPIKTILLGSENGSTVISSAPN